MLGKSTKILIVGLGMIGGSYASALKKQGYYVSAITRSRKTVEYALEHGMIDEGRCEIDPELIGKADLVIIALYPHTLLAWIKENQKYFKSGAVITDVTGVKGSVVGKAQDMLRDDVEFIAAHPMAGRERSGIEYSDDSIFRVANYIIVPTEKNTAEAIEVCRALGETLGFARISTLSPDEHDSMIAFLSQLTHCIAVSLMCASGDPALKKYTGDSFRDLTRIAKINDEMWSELFIANKEKLLAEMDRFKNSFTELESALIREDREKLREMMRLSTARRTEFDK
ncbi:MAG: prephenate dehydrogenase [Clostridia bacterium]|nr:prephenate dehydrogenase [Clostridia bacterium]